MLKRKNKTVRNVRVHCAFKSEGYFVRLLCRWHRHTHTRLQAHSPQHSELDFFVCLMWRTNKNSWVEWFFICVFGAFLDPFSILRSPAMPRGELSPTERGGGSLVAPPSLLKGSQVTQAGPRTQSAPDSDRRGPGNETQDQAVLLPAARTVLRAFLPGLQGAPGSCPRPGLVLNTPFSPQTTNVFEISFL